MNALGRSRQFFGFPWTFSWIFGLQSQPNWLHDLHDVLHLQRLYQKKNTGLQVTGVGHRIKHGMTSLKHGCWHWMQQKILNSEASWENEPDRSTCRTHQDQMLPTTPESEWNWLTRVNFAVMYIARANHDVWRCWRSPWETSVNACYGTMLQQNPIILREVSHLCWHQVFVLFVLRHDVKACRNIFKLVVELFLYCAHRKKLCLPITLPWVPEPCYDCTLSFYKLPWLCGWPWGEASAACVESFECFPTSRRFLYQT